MKKIDSWFSDTAPLKSLWWVIPLLIAGIIYYDFLILNLLNYLKINKDGISLHPGPFSSMSAIDVASTILVLGFLEECLFRAGPLQIIQVSSFRLFKRNSPVIVISTVFLTSIIFGYLHGNYLNIFIQGMPGAVYAVLYLKYGGYMKNDGAKTEFKKGLFTSTTIHVFSNTTLICLYHLFW